MNTVKRADISEFLAAELQIRPMVANDFRIETASVYPATALKAHSYQRFSPLPASDFNLHRSSWFQTWHLATVNWSLGWVPPQFVKEIQHEGHVTREVPLQGVRAVRPSGRLPHRPLTEER